MKNLYIATAGLSLLLLSSCGDEANVDLFSTIPNNTHFLTVINQHEIFTNCGENESLARTDLASALESSTTQRGSKQGGEWEYILKDTDGIDPESPIVIYEYKKATLATFTVTDEKAFREGIARISGESFSEKDDIWSSSNNRIFTHGRQIWITSGYPELGHIDIKLLSTLKENESIVSVESARNLLESDADIVFLYYIRDLMLYGMVDSNVAMGLNLAYEDPSYVSGYVNFDTAKAEGEARVLNQKMLPAKRALSPGKIDIDMLSASGAKGNLFFATSLSSSTINTVLGQLQNKAVLPFEIKEVIQNIDGTIFAAWDTESKSGSIIGKMKDEESARSAVSSLESYGGMFPFEVEIQNEGDILKIICGHQDGLPVADVLKIFENSNLGLVFFTENLKGGDFEDISALVQELCIALVDADDSSLVKLCLETASDTNSFIPVLRLLEYCGN